MIAALSFFGKTAALFCAASLIVIVLPGWALCSPCDGAAAALALQHGHTNTSWLAAANGSSAVSLAAVPLADMARPPREIWATPVEVSAPAELKINVCANMGAVPSGLLLQEAVYIAHQQNGAWLPLEGSYCQQGSSGGLQCVGTATGPGRVAIRPRPVKYVEDFTDAGTQFGAGPISLIASEPVLVRRVAVTASRISIFIAVPAGSSSDVVFQVSGLEHVALLGVASRGASQSATRDAGGAWTFTVPSLPVNTISLIALTAE